jgi:preprotein translocase subunit SecF
MEEEHTEENKQEAKQESKVEKKKLKEKLVHFHDKNYKLLLLIPILILVLSSVYMVTFYRKNNDFIYKDISLTGGTSLTINGNIDTEELKEQILEKLENVKTRDIYDLITQEKIAVVVETKSNAQQTKQVVEEYLGYELNEENSSIEFTGSVLSERFYRQLLIAILFAFCFMAIVVFILFRTLVPSTAVVISAFADIFMTLVLVNLLGIEMSSAGIVAFLMLIGYSVDTDILLTNKILKRREESLNKRIFSAFKTGITMTLTSLLALIFALVVVRSFSPVLTQIFTVLIIGLSFDLMNTWITNVSILKWYAKKKERKNEI